ncbi:hypothetical protein [Evansella halocellulosilytica]|uniref:hypothetical protein n=1 Tax=Evansella halocellulosilytica TaxID=2011013 RepID=UPI000BB716DC|nr:hypothetical protein [Evansella halocellulosilytica]
MNNHHHHHPHHHHEAQETLSIIEPAVSHGLREAQHLGFEHALREAVAIGYLMGRGQDFQTAWNTVEAWWRPFRGPYYPKMY